MNDEKLEAILRDLPTSPLPPEWRGQILRKVRAEVTRREEANTWPPLVLILQRLFQRNRWTTSVLALVWLMIFVLRFETPVENAPSAAEMARMESDPHFLASFLRYQQTLALLSHEKNPALTQTIP